MHFTVNCNNDIGPFTHFWRSTGFSPASLLLNADMQQQLTYAASTGGIDYVRVHYLLDLVRGKDLLGENPVYDWSVLDIALDVLVENNLRPFFELMGNPGGVFTDFTDMAQVYAWCHLVGELAAHCINRYSADAVRSWYFETWNEPDAWWPYGEQGLLNYYDACSEGLRAVDPALRFGGPGTSETLSPYFKAVLAHCDNGTNVLTDETGVRLDFISVHEKGAPPSREDITPDTAGIYEREIQAVRYIREHHPRFADLPFMNNECDPQVGWRHLHTWRALPYYAAIICRMLNQHLLHLGDDLGVDYALLGGDHGFVGEWGHRTLTARFADFADSRAQAEHQTQADDLQEDPARRAFELIKKPALTVKALLNLLGDRRCNVQGALLPDAPIGVIATRRADAQVAILIYHSKDRFYADGEVTVELNLQSLPFEDSIIAHYRIDGDHSNPFAAWETHGAKRHPWATPDIYRAMRLEQEPALLEPPEHITGHDLTLTVTLPLPAVSLIVISADPGHAPASVTHLRTRRYAGLAAPGCMIAWDPAADARFIQTYEVSHSATSDGPFKRVNPADTICTAYLHVDPPDTGYYRVRAVDYWGRTSDSKLLKIGD